MGITRPVMARFPYAWAFFIPFMLVATFTKLNLFIAIIVNIMQSPTEQKQHETVGAIELTRSHIEVGLHAEVRSPRDEIREPRTLLAVMVADRAPAPQPTETRNIP